MPNTTETLEIVETPAPVVKPRAKRPKAAPARGLEELDTLEAKKMSPQESVIYINACRDTLTRLNSKVDELTKNCTSAYEQYRNADAAYKKLKEDADNKLAFAARTAQVCFEAIKMQGGTR